MESRGAEGDGGGDPVGERTVLLMGSKAGVCMGHRSNDFTHSKRKRSYLVTVLSMLISFHFSGQNIHSPQVPGQVGMSGQTRCPLNPSSYSVIKAMAEKIAQ